MLLYAFRNKRKLSNCKLYGFPNLYMYENLCPSKRSIYSHNGTILFKYTNNVEEKPIRIYHKSEIGYYFPDDFI